MTGIRVRTLLGGVAVLALLFASSCSDDDSTSSTTSSASASATTVPPPTVPAGATEQEDGTFVTPDGEVFSNPEEFGVAPCGDVPWPVPEDSAALAQEAGVPVDSVEWLTYHVHAQLYVFVDGEPEIVPAGIGIDNAAHRIASLHTHDCSGQLHIEAEPADPDALTLGQLTDSWGVRLDDECFADYCAPDTSVEVYLNGEPVDNDPREVVVAACEAIAIVVGEAPDEIPTAGPPGC